MYLSCALEKPQRPCLPASESGSDLGSPPQWSEHELLTLKEAFFFTVLVLVSEFPLLLPPPSPPGVNSVLPPHPSALLQYPLSKVSLRDLF